MKTLIIKHNKNKPCLMQGFNNFKKIGLINSPKIY
nr:MAG TPA: hypothetical protein [Caudoviricetes sp.]